MRSRFYILVLLCISLILPSCGASASGDSSTTDSGRISNTKDDSTAAGRTYSDKVLADAEVWGGEYLIRERLYVKDTLTLKKCTTMTFQEDAVLIIADGGALVVEGTEDCPVVLKGKKKQRGSWHGVDIRRSGDQVNKLNHLKIKHAGKKHHAALWAGSGAELQIENTKIANSAGAGIIVEPRAEADVFKNISLRNLGGYAVALPTHSLDGIDNLDVKNVSRELIRVTNKSIRTETTLSGASLPYLFGDLDIEAPLEIKPGTEIRMSENRGISVKPEGKVLATGTEKAPIVFRSAAKDPGPGDWDQIRFQQNDEESSLKRVKVQHGGGKRNGAVWLSGNVTVNLENVVFEQNEACDLKVSDEATARLSDTDAKRDCPEKTPDEDNNGE